MNKDKPKLIVIVGPTAVGKTQVAIEIAQALNTEIISADSRQIYEELNIGVARPSPEELKSAPHHLIAEKSIHDSFTTADYKEVALDRIHSVLSKRGIAVLSGGTGLYIKAVLDGLDDMPQSDPEVEKKWTTLFEKEGLPYLISALNSTDPNYADQVDRYNHRRLIRALVVHEMTGRPFSSFLTHGKTQRIFEPIPIVLESPRDQLYQRINRRVDQMMENGLLDEVENLRPFLHLRPLQTVGYREFLNFFDENCTLQQAVDQIKQHSRNYAKRQITWFNNQWKAVHLTPEDCLKNWKKYI